MPLFFVRRKGAIAASITSFGHTVVTMVQHYRR
jgi:hypothetical protein